MEIVEEKQPLSIKIPESSVNNHARLIMVRVEFISFGEVDTFNEKYHAEVKIKSKWFTDEKIEDSYDRTKYWYPKLFIVNAMHDVNEEINYTVTKVEDGKSLITEIRRAKGCFWER